MLAPTNAETKWSEKTMEGEDALRTVECLRGRLQAERAASRAAKESAEYMGNKLKELEVQLTIEIKARKKAEKKLNILKKKLVSLNISLASDSEQSSTSENYGSSSISSAASTVSKDPEEGEHKLQCANSTKYGMLQHAEIFNSPIISQNSEQKLRDSNLAAEGGEIFSIIKDPFGGKLELKQKSADSNTVSLLVEDPSFGNLKLKQKSADFEDPFHENLKFTDKSAELEADESGLRSSIMEKEDSEVDNLMALVPVILPTCSESEEATKEEVKVTSESVRQVLDTLKHIREQLQSSMERRHLIKVG
ncbi:hypothetical protein Ancab_031957 [Ancistrocladus abbreviatus]